MLTTMKLIATEQEIIDAGITLYQDYEFTQEAIEFFQGLGLTLDQIENELEYDCYGWNIPRF